VPLYLFHDLCFQLSCHSIILICVEKQLWVSGGSEIYTSDESCPCLLFLEAWIVLIFVYWYASSLYFYVLPHSDYFIYWVTFKTAVFVFVPCMTSQLAFAWVTCRLQLHSQWLWYILFTSFECKTWLQEHDIAQELILNTESDEQLSEDISPLVSNIDTDSDNERDYTQASNSGITTQTQLCTSNPGFTWRPSGLRQNMVPHITKRLHHWAFWCSFSLKLWNSWKRVNRYVFERL
jgi:hypothetical protein